MRTCFLVAFLACATVAPGCASLNGVSLTGTLTGTNREKTCSLTLDQTLAKLQVQLKDRGLELVKTERGDERVRVWARKGPVDFVIDLTTTAEKTTRIKFSASASGHEALADAILAALIIAS
jgi:type 1 fimbria pilin